MAKQEKTTAVTEFSPQRTLIRPLIVGLGVGVVGYLLTLFIRSVVIQAVFCRSSDMEALCSNGWDVSWIIAHALVGVVSIFALVRAGVFRPLLVVVAAFVALWGIGPFIGNFGWPTALLAEAFLFTVAYGLFAWLASLKRFAYSLLLVVLVVVVIRLMFTL